MKNRSYNEEFRIATAQLLDVFNDITIDRRGGNKRNRSIQKTISVPCVYGNRSRILKSLENKNKNLKIPLISISKVSISRDTARVHDLHKGLMYQAGSTYRPEKDTPTPINIEYELTFISKYEEDMDQMVCNFIPYTRPDFYVVWSHPKQLGQHLKSQIVWDGNVSFTWSEEISETEPYRIVGTAAFTYKTWLFPGMSADANDGPTIKRINFCPNMLSIDDGNYMLDRWYDVPHNMTFNQYQNNIVCGLIKYDPDVLTGCPRPNWDYLPLSGAGYAGTVSGYWSDVSALVSGDTLGEHISGNPTFLVTDEGSMLLVNEVGYLPQGMSNLNYYDYYLETLTGDLSGC